MYNNIKEEYSLLVDTLKKRREESLKESYNSSRDYLVAEYGSDIPGLDSYEDIIMGWDLLNGDDEALFTSGLLCGIDLAIRIIEHQQAEVEEGVSSKFGDR